MTELELALKEVEEAVRNGDPENREEALKLIELAVKIKNMSDNPELDELVDAFVDWINLCGLPAVFNRR
jgi:hypothetical protein